MSKIRMGVIGCRVGSRWVDAAKVCDETEAFAVADLDRELAQEMVDKHGVERVYGDYRELLADDDVDAVGVATGPDIRKAMVIDALNAGKHVLVQKPHGQTADDVREINEAAAARSSQTLMYSYFGRHNIEHRESRDLIAEGAIGRVYHLRAHYHFRERGENYEPAESRRWLYEWGSKGGALGQHGSHYLDMAWYLAGCPKPEWAFAACHTAFPTTMEVKKHSEDYMSLLAGFEGGITLQMDASSVIPTWSDRAWDLRLRVLGTKGTIELESGREHGTRRLLGAIYDDGDNFTEEHREHSLGDFHTEIADFAAAIHDRQPPNVAPEEALTFMKLMDAIYLSAESGEKVKIEG